MPPLTSVVQQRFEVFLTGNNEVSQSMRTVCSLLEGMDAVLFGGALRDLVLDRTPRDLDIVVRGISLEDLKARFSGFRQESTVLQGIKAYVGKMPVDAWPLESTWALGPQGISEPTFEDLMRTVFFSIDAIALRLSDRAIFEGGFFKVMETGVLEIIYEPNLFPANCVMRSVVATKRFGLQLSAQLYAYVLREGATINPKRIVGMQNPKRIVGMQKAQYQRVYIEEDELRGIWRIGSELPKGKIQ